MQSLPSNIRDDQYPYYWHLADDLYGIPLPMPSVIGSVNAYLVRSSERDLLIDCGGNSTETFQVLFDALETIGVRWDKLDIFITHFHVDHIGGLDLLWRPGMRVFAGFADVQEQNQDIDDRFALLRSMWESFDKQIGSPAEKTGQIELTAYKVQKRPPIIQLHEGDELTYGAYRFQVLETPGHERNELCLWEAEKGIFFSGDVVIKGMYTSIYPRNFEFDEAGDYLRTLQRVKQLPVKIVYSGHNTELDLQEFRDACDRQLDHHQRRITDALRMVQSGHHYLMDILYHYTHLRKRRHWEDCHDIMRWDLTVEMAGYLYHLVCTGKLLMEQKGSDFYFYLA